MAELWGIVDGGLASRMRLAVGWRIAPWRDIWWRPVGARTRRRPLGTGAGAVEAENEGHSRAVGVWTAAVPTGAPTPGACHPGCSAALTDGAARVSRPFRTRRRKPGAAGYTERLTPPPSEIVLHHGALRNLSATGVGVPPIANGFTQNPDPWLSPLENWDNDIAPRRDKPSNSVVCNPHSVMYRATAR